MYSGRGGSYNFRGWGELGNHGFLTNMRLLKQEDLLCHYPVIDYSDRLNIGKVCIKILHIVGKIPERKKWQVETARFQISLSIAELNQEYDMAAVRN